MVTYTTHTHEHTYRSIKFKAEMSMIHLHGSQTNEFKVTIPGRCLLKKKIFVLSNESVVRGNTV
jgi:hypothetical protein